MIPHYQIPRNTLLWLFATQLAVLLPHGARTPAWVIVLLAFCMLWRVQVFRGRWNFPKPAVKIMLLLCSCIGLVFTFPSFIGLETLVSALFVGYGLKLLEMYHKRDALVLLYLSFFLVMTAFLFEQGIFLAIFQLLALMIVYTALIGLYQEQGHAWPRDSFRRGAVLVLQALPLMTLMFVLLPRLPSFWSIPLQKNTPKTGMGDSMSPGDFGRLVQSGEAVMRVTFKGEVPPGKDLYWRGLAFSSFDGRRWGLEENIWQKPASFPLAYRLEANRREFLQKISLYGLAEPLVRDAQMLEYDVILEPAQTPWLYALENSIPSTDGIWLSHEHLLSKHGPVVQRFQYEVVSYPGLRDMPVLIPWQRAINLALPEGSNPRAQALARQWRTESVSDQDFLQRLMNWYHAEFYYTLQPPPLGKQTVDEFLFDTKRGFCEHFASSFVFMLRAAGIPSRVVVGYQGGEFNPLQNYYLVRQYDAHAWAEVWLLDEATGQSRWQRFDPTFAVAPQRILDGFRETFEGRGELDLPLISLDTYRDNTLLNFIRLQLDSVNYQWARWVLGYDTERQFDLLSRFFGQHSLSRILLSAVAIITIFLAMLYGWLLWQERDRTPDPVLKAYRRLCRRLARRGIYPGPSETPAQFLTRLSSRADGNYVQLQPAADLITRYWFRGDRMSDEQVKQLCNMLRD